MAPTFKSSSSTPLTIPLSPLTPSAFSPFGTLVENPKTAPTSATVNQGTAQKFPQISPVTSYPPPSGKPSKPSMNLFICNPRQLTDNGRTFTINILERHPYTTQTFIPIGLDKADPNRRYLVIVAPTLEGSETTATEVTEKKKSSTFGSFWRPPPFPLKSRNKTKASSSKSRPPPFPLPEGSIGKEGTVKMKGRGLPDLNGIKAFVCRGDQAVTYGVGTWHAPMVVLGEGPIEFVVVMHENGVPLEDCEECDIGGGNVKVELIAEEGEIRSKL